MDTTHKQKSYILFYSPLLANSGTRYGINQEHLADEKYGYCKVCCPHFLLLLFLVRNAFSLTLFFFSSFFLFFFFLFSSLFLFVLSFLFSSLFFQFRSFVTKSKMSSEGYLMFVYGTLKRGQPNNHFMHDTESGHAEFVGTGHTTEQYPLVIAGKYNIPYLLYIPGQGYVSAVFHCFCSHQY